mmetsp:Transcript_60648/g.144535  ORF Transcript_60648/g.144535 Transcript_60648/m.144535 type:complete len:345 (+) Transcript_60648:153-1187(+)
MRRSLPPELRMPALAVHRSRCSDLGVGFLACLLRTPLSRRPVIRSALSLRVSLPLLLLLFRLLRLRLSRCWPRAGVNVGSLLCGFAVLAWDFGEELQLFRLFQTRGRLEFKFCHDTFYMVKMRQVVALNLRGLDGCNLRLLPHSDRFRFLLRFGSLHVDGGWLVWPHIVLVLLLMPLLLGPVLLRPVLFIVFSAVPLESLARTILAPVDYTSPLRFLGVEVVGPAAPPDTFRLLVIPDRKLLHLPVCSSAHTTPGTAVGMCGVDAAQFIGLSLGTSPHPRQDLVVECRQYPFRLCLRPVGGHFSVSGLASNRRIIPFAPSAHSDWCCRGHHDFSVLHPSKGYVD